MATNPGRVSLPKETGYAIRVKASYTPSLPLQAKAALTITKGDDGWAYMSSRTDENWIICEIGMRKEEDQKVGWVHTDYLLLGLKHVRPLPIDMTQPIIPLQNPTISGNASCLERTVHGLWRAIQANRHMIETELSLAPRTSARLFGPNTDHYPHEIMRAFTSEARQLMDGGNFHPRHLRHLTGVSPTQYPTKPGIYIRVYPGIKSPDFFIFRERESPPGTGIYGGQTNGPRWPSRLAEHEKKMDSGTEQHYRLARTCDTEQVAMVPVILFDENRPMVRQLTVGSCMSAGELTMVCLFKSWHPLLLGPTPLEAIAAHVVDFQSARVFSKIIDNVKTKTGWRPTQIVGCNWQTPIIHCVDLDITWCSWFDYEKGMKVFRCRRHLYIEKKKDGTPDSGSIDIGGGSDLFVPRELLVHSGLTSGNLVHVVVECMTNNVDHPSMFVRLPRIGPNREFKMLRSMAVRLEWTDVSGQWFTCALTRRTIWQYIDNDPTKIPAIYQVGMRLASTIQRINYTGAPGWFPSIGRVVVKHFKYEHLEQKLHAVTAPSQTKQWPAENTIQQNTARLQQLVDSNEWPTSVGVRPDRMLHNRKACDICVSQASTTPCCGKACNFDAATGTCSACKALRRPCTFTDVPDPVEKLQTGAVYSELGITTNVYFMTNQGEIQTIDPPFDPELDQDQDEDVDED